MTKTCKIVFENSPGKIVYAGQVLRGTVCLNLTEKTTVRGVYIRIKGKAYARWNVGNSRVVAKENYLDERVNLEQPSSAGD